jgi:hypothetical protein
VEGVNYTAIDAEFRLHSQITMSQAIGGNPGLALNPATHGAWFTSILDLEPVPVEFFLGEIEELVEMVVDEMAAGNPSLKNTHIDNFNQALNAYYDKMVPPTPTTMASSTLVSQRVYDPIPYPNNQGYYGTGSWQSKSCPAGNLMMGPGCQQRFQGINGPPSNFGTLPGTVPKWSNQMSHNVFLNAPTMTNQCAHKKDESTQAGFPGELSTASGQCMNIAGGYEGEISPFSAVTLAVCTGNAPTSYFGFAAECTATCPPGYRILYGTCGDERCKNANDCDWLQAIGQWVVRAAEYDFNESFTCKVSEDAGSRGWEDPPVPGVATGLALCAQLSNGASLRLTPETMAGGMPGQQYPAQATARCAFNEIVVGGGCRGATTRADQQSWVITDSFDNGRNGWTCRAQADGAASNQNENVFTRANCLTMPSCSRQHNGNLVCV